MAHSCSFDSVGGDIYLWGGFTGELSRLADFFVYNCKTACWRRLVMEGGDASPPARAFHSAVFHNGALYLFSGANGDIRYNDVWRYQVGAVRLRELIPREYFLPRIKYGIRKIANYNTCLGPSFLLVRLLVRQPLIFFISVLGGNIMLSCLVTLIGARPCSRSSLVTPPCFRSNHTSEGNLVL